MIYVEVTDDHGSVPPGYYSLASNANPYGPYMTASKRAWEECGGRVYFVKHWFDDEPVDMEEFTWVKLKAKAAGFIL